MAGMTVFARKPDFEEDPAQKSLWPRLCSILSIPFLADAHSTLGNRAYTMNRAENSLMNRNKNLSYQGQELSDEKRFHVHFRIGDGGASG
jgi:hypothetical protein